MGYPIAVDKSGQLDPNIVYRWVDSLTTEELEAQFARLQAQAMFERWWQYEPYGPQAEFHALGYDHRERLFMAGNQLGKTTAGGFELTCHLIGYYPSWWKGRVWRDATRWWAAGETGETTRDSIQTLLFGPHDQPEMMGTGLIPLECIKDVSRTGNPSDAIDTGTIAHSSGNNGSLAFKTYGKGRSRWQSVTIDGVWYDEEPPADVYSEGVTRTNVGLGSIMVTFTPLRGVSNVVKEFIDDDRMREMVALAQMRFRQLGIPA